MSTRTVDEEFLDLICRDPDLLAAEFDAILAAQGFQPPIRRHGRGAAGQAPASGPTDRAAGPGCRPTSRPRHPGIGGWARQRSPPFATPDLSLAERQVIAQLKQP